MNVLQLISSASGFYGAERVVIALSAELKKTGVNTVVAAFRHRARPAHLEVLAQAQQCDLTTEEIPYRGRLDGDAARAITTLVQRHSIDVIHSHEQTTNFYAALAARRTTTALVSTCHNWLINSVKDWLVSAADRVTLRTFNAVVVVHGLLGEQLRRFGVRKNRIFTIPNGIDVNHFTTATDQILSDRNHGDGLVVGTVARLAPEKGLDYLLKAAAIILREYPLTKFIIIGDGPEAAALKMRASTLGISKQVKFAGTCADMPAAYSSFDLFVLPSLNEAMPMALMEAMASGKPVIATAVGYIPEMIRDRENGILVKPSSTSSLVDALRPLLRSCKARVSLGLAAQSTATSSFSSAGMARRYLAVYESVSSMASAGDEGVPK